MDSNLHPNPCWHVWVHCEERLLVPLWPQITWQSLSHHFGLGRSMPATSFGATCAFPMMDMFALAPTFVFCSCWSVWGEDTGQLTPRPTAVFTWPLYPVWEVGKSHTQGWPRRPWLRCYDNFLEKFQHVLQVLDEGMTQATLTPIPPTFSPEKAALLTLGSCSYSPMHLK